MKHRAGFLFLIFLLANFSSSVAQIGGDNAFEFLNLTSSARIAATGGDFLTTNDNDITLAPTNPSLISSGMNNHLNASFVDYYSDINYGFAAFSKTYEKVGSFVASMQYISYGKFDYAEITSEKTGTFNAGETALNIGWGRRLDSLFSLGANLKFINTAFENYNAFGLAVDVAGSYHSKDESFTMSFIAKNIGRQLISYESGNTKPLPFELQFGLSKKLEHLPLRYSILYNHIEKWNLRYDDPADNQIDPMTNEEINNNGIKDFADNLMRHLVFGAELLISKNFSLRAGYNYKRRQELKIASKTSTIGFSWGFGFRVSKFHFSYARSAYHLAGSPNYITITTNLSDFHRKEN